MNNPGESQGKRAERKDQGSERDEAKRIHATEQHASEQKQEPPRQQDRVQGRDEERDEKGDKRRQQGC